MSRSQRCDHSQVQISPSSNAQVAGYNQPPPETLAKSTTSSTRKEAVDISKIPKSTTFPGPLVLPGDELSHDPKYPPQSFLSWKRLKERNPLTSNRSKLYYLYLPHQFKEEPGHQSWAIPIDPETNQKVFSTPGPLWEDVVTYLTAFFSPLEVVEYPSVVTVSKWSPRSQHLGVVSSSSKSMQQIRVRPAPDGDEACFSHQLNLLDILDFAIDILPNDAYSLIVFTSHDLYEDDDDDFCVGRAFGGSRVCVVSKARYHPLSEMLAGAQEEITKEHDWPGSHCAEFIDILCESEEEEEPKPKRSKKGKTRKKPQFQKPLTFSMSDKKLAKTPMHRAMKAHTDERRPGVKHRESSRSTWLARISKTCSHELLHCFGVDHCVYYACIMQGTASIVEDTRQPFYLCPIEQAKLKEALGEASKEVAAMSAEQWERDWCLRMRVMCKEFADRHYSRGWNAMVGWLDGRIEELESQINESVTRSLELRIDGTEGQPIELD